MLRSSLAATARLGVAGRINKLPSSLAWQETRRFQSTPAADNDFASEGGGRKESVSNSDGNGTGSSSSSSKSSQKQILDKFFADRKESAVAPKRSPPLANNNQNQNRNEPRQHLRNAISQVSNNNNNHRHQRAGQTGSNFARSNQNQQQRPLQGQQHQQQQPSGQSRANDPRGDPLAILRRNPQQQQSNPNTQASNHRQGQAQAHGQNQNQNQHRQHQQYPQHSQHAQNRERSASFPRSNQQQQQQQSFDRRFGQGQNQQQFQNRPGQGRPDRQSNASPILSNRNGHGQRNQQQQRNQEDSTRKDGSNLGGLFKTLRKPASSGLASSTSGKSDDPIEALRRKFLPNSDGKATAPALPSSAASSKNDMTDVSSLSAALFKMPKSDTNGRPTTNNNNNRPQANSQQNNQNRAPDTSAAGSEKSKYQSPLSEFIRVIQMKHAEEKAKKDPEESPLSSVPRTPLPKWRLQTNRLREMRQRRNDQRNHGAELPARFQQRVREPRKRPVFVDPRSRMVTLPSHDISLTEASLLFRQRSMKLKRILRKLGERPKKASDNDDEMMLGVDSLELVALELGAKFQLSNRRVKPKDEEVLMQRRAAAEGTVKAGVASYESFASRPPVVCIMGHVDHGKTTLMDSLRQRALAASGGGGVKEKKPKKISKKGGKKDSTSGSKNVAGTEAGGITQVISAFQVPLEDQDEVVTFLDTPGHAAFKAMRQSGSDAADIIVLVVAADDGISEQTIEILDFYKSIVKGSGGGGISLVVAMNKIDKPGIDVDESRMRIQNELYQQGILTEGLGGLGFSEEGEFGPPVQLIPVSGLTGLGVDELIEGLALQSEIMDLRADDTVRGEGIVLDARVVKGLGVVADCIIRWGSMQKGDVIVSGVHAGKIKMLKDPNDKMVTKGLPSQPVRLVGFETVPKAGDPIVCVESEEVAEDLVARRKASLVGNLETSTVVSSNAELQSSNKHMMHTEWKTRLEQKYSLNTEDGNAPIRIRIPVIIKADADGTLAAVRDSLVRVGDASSHNVFIDPVLVGVGPVLATDIQMAKESNAGIFCFNIKNEQLIEKLAGEEGVTLLRADVIYSLLDESKKVFANYLPPVPVEIMHGRAKVKAVYDIGGINSQVAGLSVVDGTLYKEKTKGQSGMLSCQFRIVRDGKVISPEGALRATSLKHFKEDVDKVSRGEECGLSLAGHSDFEEGDEIQCFSIDMKREFI